LPAEYVVPAEIPKKRLLFGNQGVAQECRLSEIMMERAHSVCGGARNLIHNRKESSLAFCGDKVSNSDLTGYDASKLT
jgi:hypothetical protein